MSYSQSFSNCYDNNHVADDSSTVFDADTVMPREVPSLQQLPPLPPLPSVITTEYHQQQAISNTSSHESPATTISELLRRINSQNTAMPIRQEILTNHQSVSSSSSSNRLNNTNQDTATATKIADSSSHSMKQPRRSSRLQQLKPKPQDQSQSSAVETATTIVDSSSHSMKQPRRSSRLQQLKPKPQDQSQSSAVETATKIADSSSHSMKQPRRSSRLQQLKPKPQDQSQSSAVETHDDSSEVEDEDYESINEEAVITTSEEIPITKFEVKWRNKFQQLCDYKRLHGHTDVTRYSEDTKQLGTWVNNQRKEYKKFKANKKAHITKERIQTLESIGFKWVSQYDPSLKKEPEWNKQFNELKEYKETHGHMYVSRYGKDDKKLGEWVNRQRKQYKYFKKNKKNHITKERIQMLESIGFEWACESSRPRGESEWNEKFTALSAYKEKYGDTNVLQRWEDNKQLGRWVSTQRVEYKKFKKNRKASITLERIQMLESIGFEWVSPYWRQRHEYKKV